MAAAERRGLQEGNGLRGMRERVQELGGRVLIRSSEGTTLTIELPRPGLLERG